MGPDWKNLRRFLFSSLEALGLYSDLDKIIQNLETCDNNFSNFKTHVRDQPFPEEIKKAYARVIKYPSCFVMIRKKLSQTARKRKNMHAYKYVGEFVRDFFYIYQNCVRFNQGSQFFRDMAEDLWTEFRWQLEDLMRERGFKPDGKVTPEVVKPLIAHYFPPGKSPNVPRAAPKAAPAKRPAKPSAVTMKRPPVVIKRPPKPEPPVAPAAPAAPKPEPKLEPKPKPEPQPTPEPASDPTHTITPELRARTRAVLAELEALPLDSQHAILAVALQRFHPAVQALCSGEAPAPPSVSLDLAQPGVLECLEAEARRLAP
eukprot:gnl/Chilomastix_cuspidata/2829.p1 GENE.gnl/Chilomastix_cuspidata/2829~~gnl/Chilomastix_cuspidata/2829.p1  ORF type:complete len:316 (+),score=127.97 gnl/Chilomastix_cuspidata/2829:1001-1948(+)